MVEQCSCHSNLCFILLGVINCHARPPRMDIAAGIPEKQHRGRGQELSSQVTWWVKLIINPNIPVYCHLLLWQQAAWLCRLLFGWFIVSKAVTVCVCVTTRSEVKQARGQSNDCSTLSRRVIDDDNLSCIRGHSSRRSRRTRTGIENRGDGHIYSSQVCVHAQGSPDGKWVCLGYRLPAASYFSHVEAITWLRPHCELLSLAERPRWRPADKRSRTS